MTFLDLQKNTEHLKPVFWLEWVIPHRMRSWIKKLLLLIALILFVMSSGVFMYAPPALTGLFFFVFALFLIFSTLDTFYYSFIYDDSESEPYLYELGEILSRTRDDDATLGFLVSPVGRSIVARLGIDASEVQNFIQKRSLFVRSKSLVIPDKNNSFTSYLSGLFHGDAGLEHLLAAHGIDEVLFLSCAKWVVEEKNRFENAQRWWSRERFESIPSLGRDWAYGKAYTLMRMSDPLQFSRYARTELHKESVDRIEVLLTRSAEANVLLVGDEGVGKLEVLEGLARKALRRKATAELADKHYFVLDLETFSNQAKSRQDFERLLLTILSEASGAGNIVFIIPDMAGLLKLGDSVGADVVDTMTRFLVSSSLQIVAIADTEDFHRSLETRQDFMRHFEKLVVEVPDDHVLLLALETEVRSLESRYRVMFSYPALVESLQSAKRYFSESPLLDSGVDLLTGSINTAEAKGRNVVLREDVLVQVEQKTGIATGSMEGEERQKLMNLETLLHERVVGQNEAISAISDALRRSRAGITNPKRPLGSFLFLGPTGVGKTETAKALSEIFFGPQAVMLRLDMTEYSEEGSVRRLIGNAYGDTPGILSNLIREHQYGVLLLDEFEKTSDDVQDLFLQILDEGFFTDSQGHKVNARNVVIVATSNAGSEYVLDIIQNTSDSSQRKEKMIDHIVSDGIFKPELLNRFDGIIIFHPLSDEHMKGVAKIMLDRLAWRMKEKGMTLVINDALLTFLAKAGKDEKFGARSLNRIIQDVVEKKIADGVISGKYVMGSTVEFSESDFA